MHHLVRRWTLPDGPPRSRLSLASVLKDGSDISTEFVSHPPARSMNLFNDCVAIILLRHDR